MYVYLMYIQVKFDNDDFSTILLELCPFPKIYGNLGIGVSVANILLL